MLNFGIQNFLSSHIPLPIDQLRLVLWVTLCFPLSLLLNKIKSSDFRLYFSTILSFYIQYSVLSIQAYFLWIQIFIVYLMCLFLPRESLGKYITFQSFFYLSIVHYRRYLQDTGIQVDVTAILMMNTCKFIMFGLCYQDGFKKDNELNYQYQRELKIEKLPTIVEYLGYVQFLPSCLVGPTFQYNHYDNYLHSKNEYRKEISTLLPATKELVKSLACVVVYVTINCFYKVEHIVSEEYTRNSLGNQLFYLMVLMQGVRMKYYAIWFLSMVGIKASGLSYEEIKLPNGGVKESFDKIQVANVMNVELGSSFKIKVDSWNMSVQLFLKRYVYERLAPESYANGEKPSKTIKNRAQSATILLSAFWHGFYPSYITSFFHWMLVLQISQQVYRIGRSNRKLADLYNNYRVVRGLCTLAMNFYFSYYGVFFILFRLNKIWIFSKASMNLPSLVVYVIYYLIVAKRVGMGKAQKVRQQ